MGRIRILSDNIANKIAAGEVVERPASVVKELLENSLDAGTSDVRIDTENAGRRLIRIQDDGCGMLRDDALLAFERHATSKLSDVKDLLSIATLGFRGEALPSVASVSRLLLETRAQDEQTGTRVEVAGGKMLNCDEIVRNVGTTITVRDLFFNVPARKKFLRSDQTELAHIASLVTHYSLAHYDKRFELFHEGKELLVVTPVQSLKERAFQVFGSEVLTDLIDLGTQARNLRLPPLYVPPSQWENQQQPPPEPQIVQFQLQGFVSGPHVQKLNRNSIFLFVNGRLIRDKLLLHAISAAYHNLMPAGCYPFALLFIDCDPSEVDVNVHPAKTEIRFRHGSFVHDFIRDTIRERLIQSRPVSAMPTSPAVAGGFGQPVEPNPASSPQPGSVLPYSEFSQTLENFSFDATCPAEANGAETDGKEQMQSEMLPEFTLHQPASQSGHFQFTEPSTLAPSTTTPAKGFRHIPETHGALHHLGADWERVENLSALPDLRPLGQLHDSFIVAAGRDGLWIIDQHVAHERILFEQVLRQRAAGKVELQQLLMPIVLQLTAAQQIEYGRIADELNASGFETEPFGNRTIAVKAAPAGVSPGDIEKVLFEILEISESELRSASLDEIRRSMAASIACRAAIKINMKLEPAKIEWLLKSLAEAEYPMTCPHGRPIALRYSTKDILKSFHRI